MRRQVGELITKPVIGLVREDMLHDVVAVMTQHNISCVPVIEGGVPVGIITERGLVGMLAAAGGRFLDEPLHKVMSAPVITITKDVYVYEALHIFTNLEIRHLVVTDDNRRAIGVITLSDIVNTIGSEILVEYQAIENYMSRVIFTVSAEADLRQVLLEMSVRAISCVIAAEDQRPIGMLSERDIVRLATRGKDLETIQVKEVMSTPVIKVTADTKVNKVTDSLREHGIRRIVVVDDEGRIAGLVTQTNIMRGMESNYIKILKQVIKEKDSEIAHNIKELNELAQYLNTILDSAIDMAIVATDEDLRIIYFNRCAERILNCPSSLAMGRRVHDVHRLHGIKAQRFQKILETVRSDGSTTFTFDREMEEELRHFQARLSMIQSHLGKKMLGFVFMVQDITERKRAEENIRFMAYHDILTGLPNRISFNERLELEIAHARRNGQRLGAMVIDLDHFKDVNDTYGHYIGDRLLAAVSGRLAKALRRSDTVARVGGDEFTVLLPDIKSDEDAVKIGKKLIGSLDEAIDLDVVNYNAVISIGIAFFPDHATNIRELMNRADQAMYMAKKAGRRNKRSNLMVYSDSMPPKPEN